MSADDKCLDKVRVQNGIKLHPPRMPSLVGTRMKNVGGGQGRLLSTRFRISRNRQAFDQRGGFSCWSTLIVAFVFGLIFGCRENTQPTAGDQPGSNASTKDLATTSEPSSSVVEQKKQVAPAQITPLQNLDKPQTDNTTPIGNSNSDNLSSEDELPFEARRRLPDDRPDINEARLNAVGIRIYRGNRLVLLTDIPDESISQLPAMADRLFEKLESHFGALPVSLDGSDFQVTGCLISDEDRFRSAGLMPQEGFTFKHGRHFNYQFWVFDPTFEYYRRHLVFHEFTHCFMTCESGMLNIPALWYIEGMAEYFGTHRRSESGDIDFGILPENFNDYDGWGRISELRRSFQQQPDDLPSTMDAPENLRTADLLSIPTLRSVMPDAVANFQEDSQYVTAWALCWLLHTHPEYKQLSSILRSLRTRSEFAKAAGRLRDDNQPKFSIDWLLTYECLIEGFDTERSFPVHSDSTFTINDIRATGGKPFVLQANLGWQDTGLKLAPRESVKISCDGRFSVNNQPRPWISEPQGVSIEYVRGIPLGQVVAILVSEDGATITHRIPVGRQAVISADKNVSVWLQVNDSSDSRSNNSGSVNVLLSVP